MVSFKIRMTSLSVALILGVVSQAAFSVEVPVSANPGVMGSVIDGSLPESSEPMPSVSVPEASNVELPENVKITIKSFSFSGNERFSNEELQDMLAPLVGREISLATLMQNVRKITTKYRDAGYPVARAYLQAQEVTAGEIEVGILEGRWGSVNTSGDYKLRSKLIEGYTKKLEVGSPVTSAELERSLLLINDIPGISTQASLAPGASQGETALDLKIVPTKKVTGSLDFNNYGTNYTGEYRLGGTINLNNIMGGGERITFRPVVSNQQSGSSTLYGNIGVQIPIGGSGAKLGLSYTKIEGDVGQEFDILNMETAAEVASIYVNYPFIRSRQANVFGSVRFDSKRISQTFDSGISTANNTDNLDVITLGLAGDTRGKVLNGGATTYSVSLSSGMNDLGATPTDPLAEGKFFKTNFGGSLLQPLNSPMDMILFLKAKGQYSSDRLVGSEQISLGGPAGVRAYAAGEATGDSGILFTAEARKNFHINNSVLSTAQMYVGLDIGHSRRNDPLPGEISDMNRAGAVVGVKLGFANDFFVDASMATRVDGQDETSRTDNNQFWLQAVKSWK